MITAPGPVWRSAALLVPFTRACVPVVDIAGGRITVVLPAEIVVPGQAEDAA